MHDADDGRRAGVDRLEHPVQPHRVLDVLVVGEVDRRALPLDVGSCAEARALAREDDRARVPDVGERLGQLRDERRVEGVPPLRPRQRHPEDVVVALDPERRHRRTPYGFGRGREALHRRARAGPEDGDDVPRAVRSRGGVRTRAAAGQGDDPRPHLADDARRLRRRGARRRQPRGEGGDGSRRGRPGAGDDGARHRAAHGRACRPTSGRRSPTTRGEGGVRRAVLHAPARVRRVGRGGEAARDPCAPHRGHGRARARGQAARADGAAARRARRVGDAASRARAASSTTTRSGRSSTSSSPPGSTAILALGTAGEGILLAEAERRVAADLFLQAADDRLQVAVHCGAQTTAETVALAAHAAEVGADAVVVIGPPYFPLDERAQYAHFLAAATRLRAAPVLRLRVRVDDRLRGRSGRARAASRRRARTSPGSRCRTRPVRALLALPPPGARRLRRAGGAHPRGRWRPAPSAPCPRSRRRFPRRSRRSCATRLGGGGPLSASSARSSSASRARPRSSGSSAAGSPGRRGRARAAPRRSTAEERDELDAWHESLTSARLGRLDPDPVLTGSRRSCSRRRLDFRERAVELLVDVGSLRRGPAPTRSSLRQLSPKRQDAEPLAPLVPDPLARRLELRKRLAELVDRRLRVEEAPDEEADDTAWLEILGPVTAQVPKLQKSPAAVALMKIVAPERLTSFTSPPAVLNRSVSYMQSCPRSPAGRSRCRCTAWCRSPLTDEVDLGAAASA